MGERGCFAVDNGFSNLFHPVKIGADILNQEEYSPRIAGDDDRSASRMYPGGHC